MKNGMTAREDFLNAVDLFANSYGMDPNQVVRQFRPTQTRLRLEQLAVTTTNQYTFGCLVNQGTPTNTEVRLNLQDSVVPTHIGFYFGNPSSPTDASYKLHSYLNPAFFGVNAAPMQSIYNGNISIMVNNNQMLVNWPTAWHDQSPMTQQTTAPGAGSPVDEFDGDNYSLRAMQPYVLLVGSQNINITLTIPAAPTSVLANSRLVLCFDGILFQNSTVVS